MPDALSTHTSHASKDAQRVQDLIDQKSELAVLLEKETAAVLKVSIATLRRTRWAGTGPRFVKLSEKRIGYHVADLNAWLDARTSKAA